MKRVENLLMILLPPHGFPSDYREKQRGIQYSIDSAKFVDDDAELVITGWAADFHGNEDG